MFRIVRFIFGQDVLSSLSTRGKGVGAVPNDAHISQAITDTVRAINMVGKEEKRMKERKS